MRIISAALVIIGTLNVQAQKSIRIGNQLWMAENLKKEIPGSWVYNGNETFGQQYGRLYTWDAAKNACPSGWRLPSDEDWDELVSNLGGEDNAGKELKASGSSGFNAQLAGYASGSSFWFKDAYGGFWSSSSYDQSHAWYRFFTNKDNSLTKTYFSKNYGFSVRCIKSQNMSSK